jgi:beta-phosphoglucomutase-like phosphatase (HAD superfamily)
MIPSSYVRATDRCVVVEGTPAGILAGRNAGMTVLALSTTFAPEQLLGALCVPDFNQVEFSLL